MVSLLMRSVMDGYVPGAKEMRGQQYVVYFSSVLSLLLPYGTVWAQ